MTTEDTRIRMVCNTVFFSSVMGFKWIVNRFAPEMYKNVCRSLVAYFVVDMGGLSSLYIVHHLFALLGLMLILGSGLECFITNDKKCWYRSNIYPYSNFYSRY